MSARFEFRLGLLAAYPDVYTAAARATLVALAPLNRDRRRIMHERSARRRERALQGRRITFLEPDALIPRTDIRVSDAREGRFDGSEIPADLERQWIQGTGPATRPRATTEGGLRNVAYALLSGADGWMFDGEDALGQVDTMSLDNQRNLKLAFDRDPIFLRVAEEVADEMNGWARGFLGRPMFDDWRKQLDVTTRLFRPRGLHLDDRHVRESDGTGFSASIVDAVLYVVNNRERLQAEGRRSSSTFRRSRRPKRRHCGTTCSPPSSGTSGSRSGRSRSTCSSSRSRPCFQLMEIRAALGPHFVGFNTGRWDYINSVADALAWDAAFVNPNIDAIGMTYGYMRRYEDRVRRAVNTPDRDGRCALWQGGMEPNIPVGSAAGVAAGMKRAVAGGEREQREGASGKWVAHWKMVQIVRPVWERAGADNQLGRKFPPLDLRAGGRRRPDADRAGAAHRPRGAGSAERRPAVRQCLRPGLSGRGPEARRLLRQRRRALSDGGHGDR